jgi:hypothetical protein
MDVVNPGSFRDPGGFLFYRKGQLYRQINQSCQGNYDLFMESGLYEELIRQRCLIPHHEVDIPFAKPDNGYKVIKPDFIPFVSYPYEWSFSQLKDAAQTTLKIQKIAFRHGMSLKDSSAYNIQFYQAKPVLIDTLSFEKYQEGRPWVAYKQFCQHFLSPLLLMSRRDIRLGQLLRIYIDGIPLDLTASLLPFSSRFSLSIYMHIFLHSKSQIKYQNKLPKKTGRQVSRLGFQGIIDSLEHTVKKVNWKPRGTEWGDYYGDTNYSSEAMGHKKTIVSNYINQVKPSVVWDIGANDGFFSRLASAKGIPTVAFDVDPCAVEKNYLQKKARNEEHIFPLLLDLTNPTPGTGWDNRERSSFKNRGPADLIFALALIHHLAISNNVPLLKIAEYFSQLCRFLIIEFIPKEDSQVQRLLSTREDIFPNYHLAGFEEEFSKIFAIQHSLKIKDSYRTLYLLKNRNEPKKKKSTGIL